MKAIIYFWMICESKNKSNLKFQNLKINGQTSLKGEVKINGAKNSALVLLAASLLTKETIVLNNIPDLSDIQKMKNILKSLGVKLTKNTNLQNNLVINSKNLHISDLPFELVNSLRASFFCIGPLLTKLGEASLALPGGCNIGSRPIDEHINGLRALGAEIEIKEGKVKAKITGSKKRLIGSKIHLGCPSVGATETLIMAATLAKGKTIIENAAREPEVQDLCQMLNKMGAKIYGAGNSKIIIKGVDLLMGCSHKVIPDRIEAGTFLIAAAATYSSITVSPVIPKHLKCLIDKLRESGSKIFIKKDSISIETKYIRAVNIKTAPFPGFPTDLQAPFTALMSIANGNSKISETIFENRMSHVYSLNDMGACIKVRNSTAWIKGVKELRGKNLVGLDLRSTAGIIIAALAAKGNSSVVGLEHLDRGYENFELKLNKLGANVTRNVNRVLASSTSNLENNTLDSDNYQAA